MKRRRFIKYAGMGSVSLLAGVSNRVLAVETPENAKIASQAKQFADLQSFQFETVQLNSSGHEIARQSRQAEFLTVELGNNTALEMVAIKPGKFLMGASQDETFSAETEWPQHTVEIQPFAIGKYPITQAQWREIAAWPKVKRDLLVQPARFKGERHPVESVSWLDAMEFCDRLSKLTGVTYRLPSEAEWEYACRANSATPFAYGNTLTAEVANYGSHATYAAETPGGYQPTTTTVGQFPPNAFGLYDMHGNVWEWCADRWHDSYRGAPTTQAAWNDGGKTAWRSLRGGSWSDYPSHLRSAYRSGYPANALNRMIGFRVCSTFT